MQATQYIAPYRTPLNVAYFQCNDALQEAAMESVAMSLVPCECYDGEILCAKTFTYEDGTVQYTEHAAPSELIVKYEVVSTKTGRVVGTYSTKKRANSSRDRHDNAYGAYVHRVREMHVKTSK